jgi:alpha-glucosidase
MRHNRKVLIFSLILILIFLVALWFGISFSAQATGQIAGNLTITNPELVHDLHSYSAGNFVITLSNLGQDTPGGKWGGNRGPRLFITHKAAPGRWLWHSIQGQAFLAAAQGKETVSETRGSYSFSDQINHSCTDQTIDAITQQANSVILQGRLTCPGREPVLYTLTFSAVAENQLRFALSFNDPTINRSYLTYASDSDEHFFGFGEQFTYFDLKGQRVPIWSSEQGIGRGEQPLTALVDLAAHSGGTPFTTYTAAPQYISSRLRSLFLENSEYVVFDFRSSDRVQISAFTATLSGRILYGNTPEDLISEYTHWAGRMRALPDWILSGAVVGIQGGTRQVQQIYQQLKERGTPVSALWLQDWVGRRTTSFGNQLWWNWELDSQHYPDWKTFQEQLNQDNVRLMLYTSPLLADAAQKEGVHRNLYQEAASAGYLIQTSNGQPYLIQNTDFSAGMVDLTNPKAVAWYQSVLREEMVQIGASGWMADFGEELPYDAVLSNQQKGALLHNQYPALWARLNREMIDALPDADQYVFFTRSASAQSPADTTLMWEGDQSVTWDEHDGLRSAITGLLSGGISGFSLNHSDIGGYTGINNPLLHLSRSKELLMRWMEFSAFTTVYRTHEGNTPDQNIQFYSDAETLDQFDRFARVYKAWEFLRKRLVKNASETGIPVDRALFINYPEDPEVYKLSYQEFLVGPDLLVAPVTEAGANSVRVYLPAGNWVHVWSGKAFRSPYQGQWITIAAPMGQPAVFYKEGIPDGEEFVQNLKDAGLMP